MVQLPGHKREESNKVFAQSTITESLSRVFLRGVKYEFTAENVRALEAHPNDRH
jgi:hypothetical protein